MDEAGWNPRLGGGAFSPSPVWFSGNVLLVMGTSSIIGLVLDNGARNGVAPLRLVRQLRRRLTVGIGNVSRGRGRGGGFGMFGRTGRSGGGVCRRIAGFGPFLPAATCVTVEVGGYAKAPLADLTCPG